MKKIAMNGILVASLMLGTIGCDIVGFGGKKGGEWNPLDSKERADLKVLYYNGKQFESDFGAEFSQQFPNVNIEFAAREAMFYGVANKPQEVRTLEFINEEQPDLLYLSLSEYEKFAKEGLLMELDTAINESSYDLEGFNPAILSLLRSKSDDKLYGLSPIFSSLGLYYNIDLFNQYNIELPRDSMSWDEVFELAKRFSSDGDPDSRVYGFSFNRYSQPLMNVLDIASAQNLRVFNPEATEVQLDSEPWRKVFELAIDAIKSGAMYLPSEDAFNRPRELEDDLFIMGRSAMTFQSPAYSSDLRLAKEQLPDVPPVNWGVVTAPVDPNNRMQSAYYTYGAVFAISANARNPRAAWEFIKFVNSPEYAEMKADKDNAFLFSRLEFNRSKELEPFFKLEANSDSVNEFNSLPSSLRWKITEIINRELVSVAIDRQTLDQAIHEMQRDVLSNLNREKAKFEEEMEKAKAK